MSRLLKNVGVTKGERKEILERVKEVDDPLEEFAECIAPKMIGVKDKKKAILMSLASMNDRNGDRGRMSILFHGPQGIGKSEIIVWLKEELNAGYVSKDTTEAGLVGSMAHGKATKGKLPKNHMGVCCIDELDKMAKTDRDALLECMSHGFVTLTGANVDKEFPANTIVIATVNNKEKLSDKLYYRFDIRVLFEQYDIETGSKILDNKANSFMREVDNEEEVEFFKKYLKMVRSFDARIKNPEEIKETIEWVWDRYGEEKINPRDHIERFLRATIAYARLNLRHPTKEDAKRSVEILKQEKLPGLEVEL